MQNKKIFNYTLKTFLGKGGMAEVWYAENNLGKPAAVKIMLQKFIGEAQVVSRFESEAKAMVQLNHPNIRQVMDFGEYEGRPFIIMEYLEGEDLNSALHSGRKFTDAELKKWWKQCVSALEHTHSKGIIHRDIKPSNIFLQKNGDVKILDFGISKVKDEISHTVTGQALGTVMFMSPEQIKDPKRVTASTDIYSLGITFAHLLKGKSPLNITQDDSAFTIQSKIVKGELDLSGISDEWLGVIKSTIISKASDRKLVEDFETYRENDATEVLIPAKEDKQPQKIESIQETEILLPKENQKTITDSPKPKPHLPPKEKKQTNPLVYILPLAVLLIGGLLYFLLKDKDSIQPEPPVPVAVNYTVFEEDGLYGYKDDDSIVIAPKFTEANPFADGRALVKTKDSIYYIHNTGKMLEFVSIIPDEAEVSTEPKPEEVKKEELKKEETKPKIDSKYLPEMVRVSGGSFMMGCTNEQGSDCSDNEKPAHRVTLSSFSIGKYPITVAQYRYYCIQTGIKMPSAPAWGWQDSHPMVNISWNDAQKYIKWLSKETGNNYRLPTEAEWEFAARGGNSSKGYKYAGSNDLGAVGWYWENESDKTRAAGQKRANELGLYDMSGNVWEWCSDRFNEGYYAVSPKDNPKGSSSGSDRVLRGGNWRYAAVACRVASRDSSNPGVSSKDIGFRVALAQ